MSQGADSVPKHVDEPIERPVWHRVALAVASIAFGVGMILLVPGLRHSVSLVFSGNFGGLRSYIRGLGAEGLALLLALMLLHALLFYPSEIVTATAGYVYGFVPGLAFVMGGWLISALLSFFLGRILGRPLLRAVLGSRFTRLESGIHRGGVPLLLAGRLVPIVPFSILGYAAGAARVPVGRFAWTTVVGFLPLTAAVAYLGSQAQALSANNPVVWIAAVLVIGLLVAGRFATIHESREPPPANPGGASPANPGSTSPANPGSASPANPGGASPASPGDASPANPGDASQANRGGTSQANPRGASPPDPGSASPSPPGPSNDKAAC